MKAIDMPFNVELIKLDSSRLRSIKPVSSTDIMSSTGQRLQGAIINNSLSWKGENSLTTNFHDDGLFSISIFGRIGDEFRDSRFSYIDIKTTVFHPLIHKALCKLKAMYGEILAGRTYVTWDDEIKDFVLADEVTGDTGFFFFVKHWEKIEFKKTPSVQRNQRIKLIEKYRDRALTDKILVMPAGLRDVRAVAAGRLDFDPINDIYRRIIGLSNTIAGSGEKVASPSMNYSRHQLQMSFNEIYATIEKMLSGKKGLVQNKWSSRRVFNGTRNVISSMDTSKRILGKKGGPKATDTILGLHQTIKGAFPLTIHLMRNGYLGKAFGIGVSGNLVSLVDPKTLMRETVELSSLTIDRWTTIDGLEKIINMYKDVSNRHKPVMVEGRYLALIYKGPDKTFKIFGSIDELPDHLDSQYVEPITLVELIYLSGYRNWNNLKVIVTRYPITGIGSSYPSDLYVKTSVIGEEREELGDDWEPMGEGNIAYEFPTKKPEAFLDTQVVSNVRLGGLGGDFDGDVCSGTVVYSDESINEITKMLHSRESYIDPAGGLRTSASTDTINLVLKNMTGDF